MNILAVLANITVLLTFAAALAGCSGNAYKPESTAAPVEEPSLEAIKSEPIRKVLASAFAQTEATPNYSHEYIVIPYPNGDVPADTGACTDVIIRAFRNAGVDLQKEVHEDMEVNFSKYPQKWGLTRTDTNIDHRRVPNLQTYFTRKGASLPVSLDSAGYKPGDVVSWDIDGKGMTHIGVVSNWRASVNGPYLVVHNIGAGTRLEDRLFAWKITGHFRYF
jgi:uncharacterized protein YijF (DUF1287 family)